MMKVLVVVASKHGSTREIAQAIAEELRKSELSVDLKDANEATQVVGYDAVVLGSAIYAGNWLPEAKSFAEYHRAELSKLPVWLFSSGPIGAVNPQPHDDPVKLAASMGDVTSNDHHIFVGKLDPADLSFAERLIAKAVRSPSGDFRDWDEVRTWAEGIAQELLAQPTPFTL